MIVHSTSIKHLWELFYEILWGGLSSYLIPESEASSKNGILRDEMIECFARLRPTSKDEYVDCFSVNLRATTEPDDTQYLDDIFAIIEQAEGLECMV